MVGTVAAVGTEMCSAWNVVESVVGATATYWHLPKTQKLFLPHLTMWLAKGLALLRCCSYSLLLRSQLVPGVDSMGSVPFGRVPTTALASSSVLPVGTVPIDLAMDLEMIAVSRSSCDDDGQFFRQFFLAVVALQKQYCHSDHGCVRLDPLPSDCLRFPRLSSLTNISIYNIAYICMQWTRPYL